jgi:hypothetical protein
MFPHVSTAERHRIIEKMRKATCRAEVFWIPASSRSPFPWHPGTTSKNLRNPRIQSHQSPESRFSDLKQTWKERIQKRTSSAHLLARWSLKKSATSQAVPVWYRTLHSSMLHSAVFRFPSSQNAANEVQKMWEKQTVHLLQKSCRSLISLFIRVPCTTVQEWCLFLKCAK